MRRTRVFDVHDNVVQYSWLDEIFGPLVTPDEVTELEFRALEEGWKEWLDHILATKRGRKRRWVLAFLRDEVIHIEIYVTEDPYEDDDPWQQDL